MTLSSLWLQLRTPRWCHLHQQLQESAGPDLCQEVPSDHHGQAARVGAAWGGICLTAGINSEIWTADVCVFPSLQRSKWELRETSIRHLRGDLQGRSNVHPEQPEVEKSAGERHEARVNECWRMTRVTDHALSPQTAQLRVGGSDCCRKLLADRILHRQKGSKGSLRMKMMWSLFFLFKWNVKPSSWLWNKWHWGNSSRALFLL